MRSLETILDEANPNKIAPAMRDVRAGEALALLPRTELVTVTAHRAALSRPAAAILAAYATAGTAPGRKTPVIGAPSAGQVQVGPDGSAVFNATDAVTAAEVVYVEAEGQIFEEEIDVTTHAGVALSGKRAHVLLEAESLTGTLTGPLTPVARGTTPTTGQAALSNAGGFAFAAADVVTRARVRYVALPTPAAGGSVGARLGEDRDY